jgi:hypothetical protein
VGAEDFVKLSVRYRVDFALTSTSSHAELVFVRGLAECGLKNTGGIVAAVDLPGLCAGLRTKPALIAAELCRAGYWERLPIGWRYVNWDKWNGAYDEVQDKRARDAERKRLARQAARQAQFADEETA